MPDSPAQTISPAKQILRGLFELRPAPAGRVWLSVRAAVCMGAPILTARLAAEEWWPAIAAVERLAYRTLSTCWALEQLGNEAAR
jgi:hypothetical protein